MLTKPEILALKKRATPETYRRFRSFSSQQTCDCFWESHKEARIGLFQKDGVWLFNCFGCKKGGDILAFIIGAKRCTFSEALKKLQAEFGESTPSEPQAGFTFSQEAAAARLPEALEFLATRGIDEDVARKRGVGVVDHPVLGLSVSIPYGKNSDKGVPIIKFRALHPVRDENGKLQKFRHLYGASTDDQLYGWPLDPDAFEMNPYLWIVESELDKLTSESYGENAISVGSATASLDHGELKYPQEVFDTLKALDIKILVAVDMDGAGNENAAAWFKRLPAHQVFRVKWPYTKGTPESPSNDPKDIGDLYLKDPAGFYEKLRSLEFEALNRGPLWREKFHTVDELPDGDIDFLIKDILPEGVSFIGALSGVGKTWFALSMTRALTTQKPFLGKWEVPKPVNVLYLCPEMNAKPFKRRCKLFGIPAKERFFCQTVSDGVPISLDDSTLAMAIHDLRPVILLDTAIRFSDAEDENAASENATGLAQDIKALQYMGARAVVCLHHRGKAASEAETMTLENVLRGTGDFGAMCDAVWGLEHDRGPSRDSQYIKESKKLVRIHAACVKPRDFKAPDDFVIQLFDDIGDFGILAPPELGDSMPAKTEPEEINELVEEVRRKPDSSDRELATKTGIGRNRIPKLLKKANWERPEAGGPYAESVTVPNDEVSF
jgi:hypothetical protein